MSHKKFFLFRWLDSLFHSELKKDILPFIHNFLNVAKAVVENPAINELAQFIPGHLVEDVLTKVKQVLSKVAKEFGVIVEINNDMMIGDINAALQLAFAEIKWPSDIEKQKFLSSFGARLLQEIKDHQMTFAKAVVYVEEFWEGIKTASETGGIKPAPDA